MVDPYGHSQLFAIVLVASEQAKHSNPDESQIEH